MTTLLLIVSALLLESVGSLPLLVHLGAVSHPLHFYLALHLLAAALTVLALLRLFPPRYRRPPLATGFTLFLVVFFVPFLGVAAALASLTFGLRRPRRKKPELCTSVSIPELPYRPLKVSGQPRFGHGGLAAVIRNAPDTERRVGAVLATRQLRDKDAIPILRIALHDPEDDVRLLSYSLLDGKEQKINSRIRDLSRQLETLPKGATGHLHEQLAIQYWELAYLGLASGDVLQHVLGESLAHLDRASELLGEEIGLLFLRGRVLLQLKRLEDAEQSLQRALDLGMSEMDVNPYLAEVAYLQRRWRRVRELLSVLDPLARAEPPLALVADYWTSIP